VLEASALTKDYGGFRAVDGVDLALAGGRVLAMVGPNGAGKTTTLRMLSGVIRPSSGQVRIGGLDLAADPIGAKRRLAWVPHDAALFDALTVWEHLGFHAAAWRVAGWESHAAELLERFDLADKRDAPTQDLSRGMKQKVSLACAAVHRPDLLLLDEPMTGLDPRAIRTFKDWLRDEAARGAAVVVSSHLLDVVQDLCTDLLVLVKGRVRFLGSMDEARAAYPGRTLEEMFFRATEGAP
jgi:ABC-2 type transport system ATP-binding protein